jgi:hypothetical protein
MRDPSYEEDLEANIKISFKTKRGSAAGLTDCIVVSGARHGEQWQTDQETD